MVREDSFLSFFLFAEALAKLSYQVTSFIPLNDSASQVLIWRSTAESTRTEGRQFPLWLLVVEGYLIPSSTVPSLRPSLCELHKDRLVPELALFMCFESKVEQWSSVFLSYLSILVDSGVLVDRVLSASWRRGCNPGLQFLLQNEIQDGPLAMQTC